MDIRTDAEIVRSEDGTLTVPVGADRHDGDGAAPSGREEAMAVVHAVPTDDEHHPDDAVESAKGGDTLPAHQVTRIIGGVLAEIDA